MAISPKKSLRRKSRSSTNTETWVAAETLLESPKKITRRKSSSRVSAKSPNSKNVTSSSRATSRSPKNNRRQSIYLKRLNTDMEEVSFSPRRTRRKSTGPAQTANRESRIPKSTSEGQLKKTTVKKPMKPQEKPVNVKGTSIKSTNINKSTTNASPKKTAPTENKPTQTTTSPKQTSNRPSRRGHIIRRPSLLELQTIDLNPKIIVKDINIQKRNLDKSPEKISKSKKAKSSSALSIKENLENKKHPARSKSQINNKAQSRENVPPKTEKKSSPKSQSSKKSTQKQNENKTPTKSSSGNLPSPKIKRLTRSAVKTDKRVKIFGQSPSHSTTTSSPLSNIGKKNKGKSYNNTPKPPPEPSRLLKQTMKQKLSKEIQAIKRVTSKVDIQKLMDADIVTSRLPLRNIRSNGTPQLVRLQHDDGDVTSNNENIPCLPSTPVSSANLPPTPKSSQRRMAFSYSRTKRSKGTSLNTSPVENGERRRSSTPIDDDDDAPTTCLPDPNVTNISKVSTSECEITNKVPETSDVASSVKEDNDSNKRSYCKIM